MSIMFLAFSALHSNLALFFFLPVLVLPSKPKSTAIDQDSVLVTYSMATAAEVAASFVFMDTNI